MAMVKPILFSIPAFDATSQFTFTFLAQGGNQIVKNQLTIRNNVTNDIVYQQTQTTFKAEHILPANTLTNGIYYNASIITYDAQDNASPQSNIIQFYCYTTPTLVFTNIPAGGIIENNNFNFEFTYNQIQGEMLNSYVVNLYNSSQNIIATSGEQFPVGETLPLELAYSFGGFDDNSSYYISVNGITINNTEISTGLVSFSVKYIKPNIYTLIELTNNCNDGYINIKSNISLIEGDSSPSPPIYINNQEIYLKDNGYWVKWDTGYSISGNFTISLIGRDFNPYTNILTLENNNNGRIELNYMNGYEEGNANELLAYMELKCTSNGVTYYIYSNYIPIPDSIENIFIWIRRINNLYDLQIENIGGSGAIQYLVDNDNNYLVDNEDNYLTENY